MKKIFMCIILSVAVSAPLFATSYHAYTAVAELNQLSASVFLTGNFYEDPDFKVDTAWDISLCYGFANYADFYMSPAGWGVIRYDFTKGKSALIGGLYLDKNNWGFHYHGKFKLGEKMALELNLIETTSYTNAFDSATTKAVIAPVFNVGKTSVYVEMNPIVKFDTVTGNQVFDLEILPGVAFSLGNGYFSGGLSIDLPVNDGEKLNIDFKTWYWFDFNINK